MKTLETLKFIGRIRSNKNRQRGFTLIELVVVIAILGVLIAVAVPQFANFQDEAELNAVASSLSSSAGTQFASDLLAGSEGDWDNASVCDDLVSGDGAGAGPLLNNSTDFADYDVGDTGAAEFQVPAIASSDDDDISEGDVVSVTCGVDLT